MLELEETARIRRVLEGLCVIGSDYERSSVAGRHGCDWRPHSDEHERKRVLPEWTRWCRL
jgi:hypothetical protein